MIELKDKETAKKIMEVFNNFGEWFEGYIDFFTERRAGTIGYRLSEIYRRNGSEANANFRLEVIRYKELGNDYWSGNRIAQVKIPFNASEKVIRSRFEKIQNVIKQGL